MKNTSFVKNAWLTEQGLNEDALEEHWDMSVEIIEGPTVRLMDTRDNQHMIEITQEGIISSYHAETEDDGHRYWMQFARAANVREAIDLIEARRQQRQAEYDLASAYR